MLEKRIRREVVKHPLRVWCVLSGNFIKPVIGDTDVKTFNTLGKEIFMMTDIKEWFEDNVKNYILRALKDFFYNQSAHTYQQVHANYCRYLLPITSCNPLQGPFKN